MSKHIWDKDESRYAVRNNGAVFEFATLEHAEEFAEKDKSGLPFARYTTHQMELEARNEGWVLVSEDVIFESRVFIDIHYGDDILFCSCVNNVYTDEKAIAYRLSNAEGYKDGIEVKPDSKEWVDGLPPVGAVCDIEFCNHTIYKATITYQGNGVGAYINPENGKEFTMSHRGVRFRPVLTEKQRVVEKAMNVIGITSTDPTDEELVAINKLYDAGMLIDSDAKENKQ